MILLTGACGFIGSVLLAELNRRGEDQIILVDHFREQQKWRNVRDLRFRDFLTPQDLWSERGQKLWPTITQVFHLGACSSTTMTDMDFLWRNNVLFSRELFTHCQSRKIPFLYASSAATYGAGELGYQDDHQLVSALRPLNPYGYSKKLFDEWMLQRAAEGHYWVGLKFFNVFGPHEYHKGPMRSMVKKAHEQILSTGRVKLFESHRPDYAHGEQQRDFVYVKDCARAMVELALDPAPAHSGLYNLGTGKARSWNELARSVFQVMGKEVAIDYIPMPADLRDQYQYFTQAPMQKLLARLPHFKFLKLEEAVADYIEHLNGEPYLSQRHGKKTTTTSQT